MIDGEEVDQVDTFNFLGSLIGKEGGSSAEIKWRLAMAKTSASTASFSTAGGGRRDEGRGARGGGREGGRE